ncbi:NAD(P)-binding domain-containing protein [Kribbella deserti]|uniref:NAD(P)-binding domain-containing protein n=1 Tax=Kribbella deserti TaxID=1926257 RepID=A0ABV6QN52_9ACTN
MKIESTWSKPGGPMNYVSEKYPVVVIGGGPVGLAAAAHLAERGLEFVIMEAGPSVAAAIEEWRHVRLFSPWRYATDLAAQRLLKRSGWIAPDLDALPTGGDLIDSYLGPLAKVPELADRIQYGAEVVAVTRLGFDRIRTAGRADAPFLVRLADGSEILAGAVIDAAGTWRKPNVLGAFGIPARGESEIASQVSSPLPDVLGRERSRFAGRRNAVVGAGHSAATTLLDLGRLAEQVPGTEVVWVVRGTDQARTYGGGAGDGLPARGALGSRLKDLVQSGRIKLVSSFRIESVHRTGDGRVVLSAADRQVIVDTVVKSTGFRPDHDMVSELRLDLDPILGSTRALAPLIDPNKHSCGTVPPHGVDELSHPEPGYYAVGAKAYGRAPTFLLATGYEQARSVAAALAGDWEAARDVQLNLPKTGVCSSKRAGDESARSQTVGRGLATGLSGGLATAVKTVEATGQSACCG